MESAVLKISRQRLNSYIEASAQIGKTENGGLYRLALTPQDQKIRDYFKNCLIEAGLEVKIDDFGNMYGWRQGENASLPPLVLGSHLDTQANGGKFDGVIGVMSALEIISTLNEQQITTEHPLVIVNFTNEEGARFAPPMLGSGGLTGELAKDFIYSIKDEEGVTFEEALEKINYKGNKEDRLTDWAYFMELHIEQGPTLDKEKIDIGVVEGIQGMSWLSVKVEGCTNHAGPTPMEDRQDALVSASKMVTNIYELAGEFSGLKTTVGKLNVFPNSPNVIPGVVEFNIDIRHENDHQRHMACKVLKERLSSIAFQYDTEVTIHTIWDNDAVLFDQDIINSVEASAEEMDYSYTKIFSGPGHDAKYMSAAGNSGMIFVPSTNGISHNEQEFTDEKLIAQGADVLLKSLLKLDKII
ncbi:Zn-dependent hydrolase [Marinococcus halophilus]|uniref:Zn-dependent hydrolase n=1 Tax=Marinococcus halophilus TaxID=1371 RepID=A0A510Y980_MARHA|nr:M20 family metallo-hydrolase [Marinococcus halophilus]OZT79086.1 Zn-dependent hydrolase [Marinococcus halophilus]GEK59930.1 Zn-dependent hydrolase [Marinococcus halophilus]